MAPRRKCRSDIGTRIKSRPPCRAMCKLCCYALAALTVLIGLFSLSTFDLRNFTILFVGLIVLVVILVSLFPLPLDKLKEWIISKTNEKEPQIKVVPCSDLKVTDVWSASFPKLISESSVQVVDITEDGVEDVIFGFGTSMYCVIYIIKGIYISLATFANVNFEQIL